MTLRLVPVFLTILALSLLVTPVRAEAEATFRIPTADAVRTAKEPDITTLSATTEVSATALSRLVFTPRFWRKFGTECETDFEIAGLGGTKSDARPVGRLAAIERFSACVDRLSVVLDAQSIQPVQILAADAIEAAVRAETAALGNDVKGQNDFLGLRLGVGVGISHSWDDVIPEAVLGPGGVVVATKDNTTLPRVILESHYYGWSRGKTDGPRLRGIGPYFGIVAKSEKLISAFSLGLMVGWKDKTPGDPQGFSIGIGAVLDDDVKSLAKGFEEGKPLPAGETEIRFVEKSRWSGILFFTRTF